jgi:hypothetical protein
MHTLSIDGGEEFYQTVFVKVLGFLSIPELMFAPIIWTGWW